MLKTDSANPADARSPDLSYDYYVASWKTDDGRRRNVRFSVSKHGKKAAFDLACLAREHRLSDRDAVQKLYEKGQSKSPSRRKKTAKSAPKPKVAAKKSKATKNAKVPSAKKKQTVKKKASKASKPKSKRQPRRK